MNSGVTYTVEPLRGHPVSATEWLMLPQVDPEKSRERDINFILSDSDLVAHLPGEKRSLLPEVNRRTLDQLKWLRQRVQNRLAHEQSRVSVLWAVASRQPRVQVAVALPAVPGESCLAATIALHGRGAIPDTLVRRLEYVKLCVRLKRAMGSQP